MKRKPIKKHKRFYRGPRPCCATNLKEWDCGCAWGCEHCSYRFQCAVCGDLYSDGAKSIRGTLKACGILDAKLQIFKLVLHPKTKAYVDAGETISVFNHSKSIHYEVPVDSDHGWKLRALLSKTQRTVFVLAAYSKSKNQIIPYEYANTYKW